MDYENSIIRNSERITGMKIEGFLLFLCVGRGERCCVLSGEDDAGCCAGISPYRSCPFPDIHIGYYATCFGECAATKCHLEAGSRKKRSKMHSGHLESGHILSDITKVLCCEIFGYPDTLYQLKIIAIKRKIKQFSKHAQLFTFCYGHSSLAEFYCKMYRTSAHWGSHSRSGTNVRTSSKCRSSNPTTII
jgi:hypothetical protein